MSELNYELSAIKLNKLEEANGLLADVEAELEEINAEQSKLRAGHRTALGQQTAEAEKVTAISAIKRAAQAIFKQKQTAEEIEIQLELLEKLKQEKTAELLLKAKRLSNAILREMYDYIAPYEAVLGLGNAAATDEICFELNQHYSDYVSKFNATLQEAGWHVMYATKQPTFNGSEIQPLRLRDTDLLTLKGQLLIEAMKGIK